MNSESIIFYKIYDKAVRAKGFQQCLTKIRDHCDNLGVKNPILILDQYYTPCADIKLGWLSGSVSATLLFILKSN